MMTTVHDRAMALLKEMAADIIYDGAVRAINDDGFMWVEDAFGTFGLVRPSDLERHALIVVYPREGDFEVDDAFEDAVLKRLRSYR